MKPLEFFFKMNKIIHLSWRVNYTSMYNITLFSETYKVYKLFKRKILMKSELKMLIYTCLVSSIVCLKHLLPSTEKNYCLYCYFSETI